MYDALLSSKVKWHALCPLVDMANHSSRAASEMTYAYFGDALELSVGGLSTAAAAAAEGGGREGESGGDNSRISGNGSKGNNAFEKGEQVFISYGPQTNDSLLQYYGFVEQANPNDVYRLVWEVVDAAYLDAEAAHSIWIEGDAPSTLAAALDGYVTAAEGNLASAPSRARPLRTVHPGAAAAAALHEGSPLACEAALWRLVRTGCIPALLDCLQR